jgi:hypothetical protein
MRPEPAGRGRVITTAAVWHPLGPAIRSSERLAHIVDRSRQASSQALHDIIAWRA